MTDEPDDVTAAEFALGALGPGRRAAASTRMLHDPAFRARVEAWELRLAPLAETLAPVSPPAALWAGIEAALDASTPGTATIRRDEGWRPMAPGIAFKDLGGGRGATTGSWLLRCEPGARLDAHHHDGLEETLVLEGWIAIGDEVLRAGDFHTAQPGSDHPGIICPEGALLLIRTSA